MKINHYQWYNRAMPSASLVTGEGQAMAADTLSSTVVDTRSSTVAVDTHSSTVAVDTNSSMAAGTSSSNKEGGQEGGVRQ